MTGGSQLVEYERIRILYSGAPRIVAGGGLLVIFLAFFLHDNIPIDALVIWICVALTALLPRLVIALIFRARLIEGLIVPDNIAIWERLWIYTAIPLAGSFSALILLPLKNEQMLLVALCLTVVGAGNLMTSSTSLRALAVANCIIFFPLITKLLFGEAPYFPVLAAMFVACIIVFSNYAMSLNNVLVENIRLKIVSDNLSLMDMLTGLHNRRGLYLFVDNLIEQVNQTGGQFGLIMIDIDYFKQYNDTYGHSMGDEALISVANCILQEARSTDLVVRYGGEEFIVVLPGAGAHELEEVASRICERVRANCHVTISAGLACYYQGMDFDALVKLADKALYAAKEAGRDQFITASKSCSD